MRKWGGESGRCEMQFPMIPTSLFEMESTRHSRILFTKERPQRIFPLQLNTLHCCNAGCVTTAQIQELYAERSIGFLKNTLSFLPLSLHLYLALPHHRVLGTPSTMSCCLLFLFPAFLPSHCICIHVNTHRNECGTHHSVSGPSTVDDATLACAAERRVFILF